MRLTDIELKNTTSYETPYGKVILVGLLNSGPVAQPFALTANKDPFRYLGNNPTTVYARRLLDYGVPAENILYYRLNGQNARFEQDYMGELAFDIVSLSASPKHNNVLVTFSPEGLSIRSNYTEEDLLPNEKNYIRTYRYADYPYTSQLANAINSDSVLGLNDVIAREFQDIETLGLFTVGEYHLDEGNAETSYIEPSEWNEEAKENYYQLFAHHVLGKGFQGQTVSNILDVGAEVLLFPDISVDDFPEIGKLASFIAQQKTEIQYAMCYVVFHTSDVPSDDLNLSEKYNTMLDFIENEMPNKDLGIPYEEALLMTPSDLFQPYQRQEEFVDKLMSLYESDDQTYPNYQHLMIAIGSETVTGENGISADLPLAELIISSETSEGLSNKEIAEFRLINTLTPAMFARLSAKGYTYIVPSIRKNFVFENVQDMNLYIEDSILRNWSNRRNFKEFEYELNLVFDNYIGGPFGTLVPSTLERELEDLVDKFINGGRVKSGTIDSIQFNPMSHSIDLKLSLVFYQELKQVRGTVEIKKDGWDIDVWSIPS